MLKRVVAGTGPLFAAAAKKPEAARLYSIETIPKRQRAQGG